MTATPGAGSGTHARRFARLAQRDPAALLLLAGLLLVPLLLAWIPGALDGMDSVNFALALREFDPGLEQPHWPGYPLYILLARTLYGAGLGESAALALPGVLGVPALAFATARLARELRLEPRVRLLAGALLLLHPLLLDQGPRPIPDLLGTTLAWSALALLASVRARAGGLLFGLALGVRIDLAPLAAALLSVPGPARRDFSVAGALGVAAWALPLAAQAPPEWLPSAASFAGRHFSVWGSSLVAGAGERGEVLAAFDLLGPGLGALLASGLGARALPDPARRFLACGAGAYTAWVLAGQNLAHARHWLPLLPALCLCLAQGLTSLAPARLRAGVALAVVALAVPAYARAFAPDLDGRVLVERALAACARCDALFVCDEKRFFDRYAPRAPVYRRDRLEEVSLDAAAWGPALRGEVGVLSSVRGAAGRAARSFPVAPGIVLYRIPVAELR